MSTVDISDVGPIRKLQIPVEPGTVVVLEGGNGKGKSTALRAVATGIKEKGGGLTPRDFTTSGTISLPGVTVRIGARVSAKGEASHGFVLVDTSGVGQLINPGVKDPAAADKKRLQALVDIAGIQPAALKLNEFLGDLKGFEIPDKPVTEIVSALKRWLDAQSRDAEGKANTAQGALQQIGEIPDPSGEDVRGPEEVQRQLVAADNEASNLRARQAEAREASESISQAATDIPSVEETAKASEAASAEVAALRERLASAEATAQAAKLAAESAQQQHATLDRLKAKVANGVSEQDVLDADAKLKALKEEHAAAVKHKADSELATQLRQQAAELKAEIEQQEGTAKHLRGLAAKTPELLSVAVDDLEGWTIDKSLRLCCEHARGAIPFSELSPGEQAIRAIEVVSKRASVDESQLPIGVLPQDVLESLDQENRAKLVEFARESGMCIISGLASSGDVTANVIK